MYVVLYFYFYIWHYFSFCPVTQVLKFKKKLKKSKNCCLVLLTPGDRVCSGNQLKELFILFPIIKTLKVL